MADLKYRTGASATVTKSKSLEEKLAGIMGTSTGNIKKLESQLRREREAEEARKKAEEEARKRAEAAAAASVPTQTPTATTGSTSKPIDTQYIKDLQKQRAQLQSAASTGDRTAMQKINEINRLLQEAQKGATAPTAPTAPTAQPTRDFSWETDETVLQREKELASAKTGVAREAQRKSENYVERQGRKLDAMEEELKRLRAAAHNGDTESGKAYNELLGQYNTALDLYNQASTLANRRETQFYEGIEEVRQINQQIAGTQKYSDEAGAVYEAEYNAAKDALQAATTLASDYNTAVVPGYSDYIYDQVKAAEDRFAQADEAFTLWKQEREAYLREKTLLGIPSEDLSLFREVLNDRNRDVEATLRQKYGEEYDTILMFMRRQANAEKWQERGAWISDRGAVGDALLSVASVATNLLSAPGVIYEYIVQGKNGDRYLPLDTNAGGFWMQNATRKIRESVTDDIESDAWDLIYQTAMSGIDSYLTARIFGSKATYVLGATAGANAATDITERGGTVQQAIVGGILAGAIEGFFEDFSIGQMQALQSQNLKMNTLKDAVDLENIKTLVANIAKSTGVNFSEEANTEIANVVMDTLLMGDLSEITMSVQRLMAEDPNLDERAAKKIVAKELATQVILSGVSGALMGAAFGAIDTAKAGFRTYALNTDTREVLRQAQQTAATLPWEWRPEFRYEAGASYEQVDSYAEKVYNAAQEYLVEMQNNEALNPEETASVRDEVSNLVNVRVRTKTTVDKVLAAEEAGRAAADAETAAVTPQNGANVQDANVVGAEENVQAVGAQQDSEAVVLARELLQEHTNTYSGEALAREVANTVQILKNEGRFDISDAFEAEYNNYINGGNTNGEAGQAGVLLSDGQRRVYAESAGGQTSANSRTYERGSAAGSTRAESTQSGSGIQQTVWKPEVKSSELVASGTNRTVRMLPEAEYSNENYADAVAEIKRAGFTPVLVRDALTVRSTNGKNLRVNGVATPDGRIVLRVGADKTQNRKLGRHEIFHAMFMKAKNRATIMNRILTTLKNKYSEAEITDMLNVYFDKYRNTYSDENRIIEEFLADAYAGMNRFGDAKVDKYTQAVVGQAAMESATMETDENGDAGDWYANKSDNANANLTFAVPYDTISHNSKYKQLYAEAKSGNYNSAAKLVNALTNRDYFASITRRYPDAILMPLSGAEMVSDNVIPIVLAQKIARITGMELDDNAYKTTTNKMRQKSASDRMVEPLRFAYNGSVESLVGKHFVVVDDTIATGTTVNAMARWLESHGAIVDGFVSLAKGKDTVSSFQITPEQIQMLERRYGRNAIEAVIREYGYADRIEDLTRRQADVLAQKPDRFGLVRIDSGRGARIARKTQSGRQIDRTSSVNPNEATEESLDGFSIAEEEADSDGNALSEQQAEYFADSQVRDAQGRLLRLYHQTGNLFTVFDTRREGAGSRDDGTPFGVFLKTSNRDIGLQGKFQMPLYANITNPLRVNNREELRRELESLSAEYASLLEEHSQLDDEYHERFETAKRELRNFMTEWRKNNPQASRTALYEVPEFDRLYNAEDEVVEEWTKEADKLSTQAKEVLTQALRDAGYDGVIINTDTGSFGRSTDAFIALDANQVKNTDNLTPTDNPDIRYSVEETEEERMIREDTETREGVIRQFAEDYGLADRIEDARDVAAGRKEFSDLDLDNSNDLHNMADLVRRFLQAKNSGYDRILAEFGGLKINETAAPKPPEPKVSAFRSNTLRKILGDKAEKYFRTEDYTYLPISEQDSLRAARDRLNTDAEGVIEYLRKSDGWGSSDMDAAYAIMGILKHEADVTHDYNRLNEWVKLMREQNTRAGQLIQANAKYSRNPYTLLLKAEEVADMIREQADENNRTEAEELANQIMENTSQQVDALNAVEAGDKDALIDVIEKNAEIRKTKVSRRIKNALRVESFEFLQSVAIAQVENIAVDMEPVSRGKSALKKIGTYQTMAQLLNLRTAMRNVVSNQVFDIVEAIATNPGALADMLIGSFTHRRSVWFESPLGSKAKRKGATRGARRAAIEVSLDVDVSDAQSKYGTKNRRTWNMQKSSGAGRFMSHLERIMGYELNVTDEFLKGGVEAEVTRGLQPFVNNGTISLEEAQEMARQEALYRSFQDDTLPSELLRRLKNALNVVGFKSGDVQFGLGDFVQKYTQVPGALISRAVEFSPLGYAKAIYCMFKIRKEGSVGLQAQRQAALAIGRAFTGTGLIAAFMGLAKLGILKRRDDEENKDVAALSDSEGVYGTQINLFALWRWIRGKETAWKKGDWLVDVDFMEPINALMSLGTAVASDTERGFFESVVANSFESLFNAILETPTMQSWQQLSEAIRYATSGGLEAWTDYGIDLAASSITGFVPSLVRQVAQASDYAYRDQYSSQRPGVQLWHRFLNTIPIARQTLPEKLDNFGDVKDYEDPWINALNSLFMPGGIYVYERGEISEELARLREATGEEGMYPSRYAPYNLELNLGSGKREKHELTIEERTRYQTTRGTTASLLMSEYMASAVYENASDEQRAAILTQIADIANDAAKRELYESLGIQYRTDTFDKYYSLVAAGVPSSDALDLQYRNSALQKYYSYISDGATDSADAQLALLKEMGIEITGVQNLDKLALIRQYNVPNSAFVEMATEFISDARGEDFDIMLDAGLTQEDVALLFNEYTRLNKNESLSAFDKATEFAHYVDMMGIKNDARNVALDTLTYSSGFRATADTYQKYVDAGLDADTAKSIYDAINALEPLPGNDEVTGLQKMEAIVAHAGSPEDQIAAYVAATSADEREKTEAKLREAYAVGITPKMFVDYRFAIDGLDAKDANGETVTNLKKARVTLAIDALDLTDEQKDYLWLLSYKEKGLNKTPWHTGRTYSSAEEYVKYL